jgi:hypothetical protein
VQFQSEEFQNHAKIDGGRITRLPLSTWSLARNAAKCGGHTTFAIIVALIVAAK